MMAKLLGKHPEVTVLKFPLKYWNVLLKKILLESYLKGKKESKLFTLLWSINLFQSHTRDLMDTKYVYF